jgi:hypothetical protein
MENYRSTAFKEGLVAEIKRMYEFSETVSRIIVNRAYDLSEKDGFEAIRATAMFLANFAEEIDYAMKH